MNKPKVSFVMPVYNRVEWVAEAVQGLLAQSVKDIEVIAVDDGSTDGTREFLEEWGTKFPHFKLIKNETNLGAGPSRNKGIEAAQSDIVAMCDSDDAYASEYAELIIKHFEKNPTSELVNFPYNSIGYFNEIVDEYPGEEFNHELFLKTGEVNYFCNPACAFKKASFLEMGGYEKENEIETDDIQFLRKWVKSGKKVNFEPQYIPLFHRVLPDSMMSKKRGWTPAWVTKQ